jgi:GH25 family lysozyme M1 (1,4-beta-N-acetylmuramidase)
VSLSRLGPHDLRGLPAGLLWASKASIVKSVGSTAAIRVAPEHALRVYRWPWNEVEQDLILKLTDASSLVGKILSGLGGYRHPNLWVELLNEVHRDRSPEYRALALEAVPVLHAHGLKVALPSWSTGSYEQEDWDGWRAIGWAGADAIALHAYWGALGPTIYNGLRWRRYWRPGDLPVLITETGIDAIEGSRGGWKMSGLTDEQYLRDLVAYDAEIAKDPYVLGACVFTTSPTHDEHSDWRPFGVDALCQRLADLSASTPAPPAPPQENAVLAGLDCSNHQGAAIGWDRVAAAGVAFAWIKASEDPDFFDTVFPRNWFEARKAGLVTGAYHYARPDRVSPAASVTLFEKALQGAGGLRAGDLIALDLEEPHDKPGSFLVWAAEWLALAERVFGVRPVLYTAHWFAGPHGLENGALGSYPLWWAAYTSAPEPPPVPQGWEKLTFWQYTSAGRVPGVPGDVDLNRFFGTLADLRALGKPATAETPAPPAGVPPAPSVAPAELALVVGLRDRTWALASEWGAQGYAVMEQGLKTLVELHKGER